MEEVKDIILNIGAFAGFAAMVGLAILSMLYFSQARDVRRLREWAGREPERAAEIELRAQQMASQAIAQAYESMAYRQSEADAAAAVAEQSGMAVAPVDGAQPADDESAEQPGVVDGSVPPVAAEATAVDAGEGAGEQESADEAAGETPQPVVVGNGAVPAAAPGDTVAMPVPFGEPGEIAAEPDDAAEGPDQVAVAASAAPPTAPSETGPAQPAVPVLPPLEEGEPGEPRPSRLAPSTAAATRASSLPPLPPLGTSEFDAQRPVPPLPPDLYLSTGTTGGTGSFEFDAMEDEGPKRLPFIIAGVLVAIFGGLLIFSVFTGGDEPVQRDTAAERRAARDQRATSTAERNPEINRPAVTITVLNGTDTPGLANRVGDQLKQAGFTQTTAGNRNDGEQHVESVVFYAPGSRLEADEVAKELDIESVRQIDTATQAAGGSAPVVVVLGVDIEQ